MISLVTGYYSVNFVFKEWETLTFAKMRELREIAKKYGWVFEITVEDDKDAPDVFKNKDIIRYYVSLTNLNDIDKKDFLKAAEDIGKKLKKDVEKALGKTRSTYILSWG